MNQVLGIGGILGEAACAVFRDGQIVSAVEQKKLARRHTPGELPREALQATLELAGIRPEEVTCVALVRPFSRADDTGPYRAVRALFPKSHIVMVDHHLAHAASAFYASPFEDASVLTLDRAGDFRCAARWRGHGAQLTLERELYAPDSLGDLYSRVTELLGFQPGAEEHKVQWLSTSGEPKFADLFRELLNGPWQPFASGYYDSGRVTRGGFSEAFFGRLGITPEDVVKPELRAQIAASLQTSMEEIVAGMAGEAENLCLAGGLGYNALLVAALEAKKKVFVQPAAGNAGSALGAAYYAAHVVLGEPRRGPLATMSLGPSYRSEEIKQALENCKLRFRMMLTTDEMIDCAVQELNDNKIVAWMQGRMEFGPRALGNRSILASPLNPYSTENLNVFIKHREPFRKFAASVPLEAVSQYFEAGPNARFLATVSRVKPEHRKTFEAAILGDNWVRVHVVDPQENPLYHRLLLAAGRATGLPVLYNTSFNLFGDPLVCTPRDAVRSFYSSGIDALFVGNFQLTK